MRIVHTTDLHIDSALTSNLSEPSASERRRELLYNFERLVNRAREINAEIIIIAGDLFDSQKISRRAKDTVLSFEKEYRTALINVDKKKSRAIYKKLNVADTEALPDMLTLKSTSAVISALLLAPQGVVNRFPESKEVEASVNLGIINTTENNVAFSFLARSASKRSDNQMRSVLERLAHVLGSTIELESYHGCWEYKKGTPLQSAYESAYGEIFGGKPDFFATHAGLECGTFYEKLSSLGKSPDIISVGPNMYDIHTPIESLEIASVGRIYDTAKVLLRKLCE